LQVKIKMLLLSGTEPRPTLAINIHLMTVQIGSIPKP
jgi:hypothetical protein